MPMPGFGESLLDAYQEVCVVSAPVCKGGGGDGSLHASTATEGGRFFLSLIFWCPLDSESAPNLAASSYYICHHVLDIITVIMDT